MYIHANIAARRVKRLAGMESHADPYGDPFRPRMGGHRSLRGDRRGHRLPGLAERRQKAISLVADLVTVRFVEDTPKQCAVIFKNLCVAVGADTLEEVRGPLDVREEKRDRSGR
ncbi:MAG TPA: hypothetical protein VFP86_07495 [bacterium]|nr:hypothetical protein [bacterium]